LININFGKDVGIFVVGKLGGRLGSFLPSHDSTSVIGGIKHLSEKAYPISGS
jgi:hypothetical protein